jgi:class 3 adenylate cyclase/tetratricopeptide (TPR) repeat protein
LLYYEVAMSQDNMQKESERRLATVMFADISGFTAMSEKMDPEEVTCTMNDCFCMMGECIAKHGGTIDKFIGDCVMALFGVPKALEDTPQKAVNTAIELRNCLQKFNREKNLTIPLNLHIGINTGPVLAGMVGSDKKQDYTVMGDTVNLASRLEDASRVGQILVGSSTYEATRAGFRYRALEPIALKGKAEPVPVYELLSIKETLSRVQRSVGRKISSVMVGRDSELNKLEFQVMKAVNGEGSIVNIIGEAGIGKSRLIAELKNRDVMKRVTLREGRAISMGANLGYHLIIDILKNWTEISDDDNAATAFGKLESAIRDVCRKDSNEIFPFVATLMGIKLVGRYAERVKGIEGEALEKLILKNVRDLIIKSTDKIPLVIILEDLHWADMSSIELLESLFRLAETQRVIFINIFRPGYKETGERVVETIRERLTAYYVEINLEPLSEEMSETLIDNMLNIKGLPHGIKNKIIQRAGGNPFFIEEVVRSFIDEGAVTVKDEGFEVTEKIETMVIPHTINDVLMARIDRLEDETRNLIKVASVIGRNFFYKILAEVAHAIEDIDNRLEYLKEIQLIKERKRMEELEYLFKHALAQEAAYESILVQKRKEIHRNVADSIEKIFTDRLHEFYGILSYHYIHAEDWDKAEEYILKAGEEALKSSASSEALNYYQRAIELYIKKHGDDVDNSILAGMEENIAYAFLNKGFFLDAVDYFDRAAINRGERIHSSLFVIIPKLIINLSSILLHLYLPSIRKKKIPSESESRIMQRTFKIASALAMIDIKRFIVENMEAVKPTFKYDISKSQGCFNMQAGGGALFIMGGISLRIARKFLDYLWENISGEPPDVLLYMYRTTELLYNCHTGNWRREIDEGSVNEALRAGDFMMATAQLLYSVYIRIEVGDFTECETIIEKLHRIYEEYNFEHAESDVFVLKSKLSMKKRELYDAQTYADKSIIQSNKTKWYGRAVECLGIKTRIEILAGNPDGARETIEEAEKLVRQVGKESIFIDWYCAHVMGMFLYNLTMLEKALLMDKPDDIEKFGKATLASGKTTLSYTRKKGALERTESFRLMGTYYWLINNQKKALTWWLRSIQEGENLGAKIELSRSYFEVGKRLLEPVSRFKELDGITAEDYLEKARGMFEEMDLQWDLDELDKVRAYRYH